MTCTPHSYAIAFVISACLVPMPNTSLFGQQADFSGENAFAILKVLANDIGPRPMGSPAEQRALAYAVSKFAEYGCQESYVIPCTVAQGINTNSGIAVGVLKGNTGRIIVIGGHIDSAGPEIPGANDDGSGAACVMELARVLGRSRHESTLVFCCWGGEEEGLLGSDYFVDHFSLIDSVALMLQIDMADGAGALAVDPDAGLQQSAPRWLTKAAYEVYFDSLHYEGLTYPTHFAALNSSLIEGTGSDQAAFIEKGIPAIDFTADVDYPIHTPEDDVAHFTPAGLERSGNLVLGLVRRFDGGVPDRTTEQYYLIQVGNTPLFFLHSLLRVIVIGSAVLALVALFVAWRRRKRGTEGPVVRWSGAKIVLYVLIVQACIWSSDHIVELVRGVRYPWVNNFTGFVILGLLCGLGGFWCTLQLARRWRIGLEPFPLYLRSVIMLLIFTGALALANPEVALYMAAGLFCVSMAMLLPWGWMKLVFVLLSPYLAARIIFSEYLGLFQRSLPANPLSGAVMDVIYVVVFTLISLPFAYAFAAAYRDARIDLFWIRKFRSPAGLGATLFAIVLLVVILSGRPVYDRSWYNDIRAEEKYTIGADTASIQLRGGEFLAGTNVRWNGHDTLLTARITRFEPGGGRISPIRWASVESSNAVEVKAPDSDSSIVVDRLLRLSSAIRPLSVQILYTSTLPIHVFSPRAAQVARKHARVSEREKRYLWYSFPDTALSIPLEFTIRKDQTVRESIEITYDTLATPLDARREFSNVIRRTVVTRVDNISGSTQ
jgi:hypothetical protein